MNTFIDLEDINILCQSKKTIGAETDKDRLYGSRHEEEQSQNKSDSRRNLWSRIKSGIKSFWGKAKPIITGITEVMGTVTIVFKGITRCAQAYHAMKEVMA